MEFQFLVNCATFRAVWTTLVTVFSKIMSIFIISMLEIGTMPILRRFYVTSIFCHLCHFLCHLDQFRDKILQNHAHIRNQHV